MLHPLRSVGVIRLFGSIMAGYLLAMLIPLGFGTVARSWLVARREGLKLASVLATVALDRLTDGIVFACLVPLALASVVFDDPTGGIRAGLVWGGALSFLLFAAVLLALAAYRRVLRAAERHRRGCHRLRGKRQRQQPDQQGSDRQSHGCALTQLVSRPGGVALRGVGLRLPFDPR